MRKLYAGAALLLLALAGCSPAQLTKTEAALCTAQSAANAAGAIATQVGDAKDAKLASEASTVAGAGCVWAAAAP